MREIPTARLVRGQTIRTRADVMRTERIHERSLILAWTLAVLWWGGWLLTMTVWASLYIPVVGLALVAALVGLVVGGGWGLLAVLLALGLAGRLCSRMSSATWYASPSHSPSARQRSAGAPAAAAPATCVAA